ncbi:hypothetical protein [Litoribacter populi]|uniref:hypothetical protein n=1 Tax=Litoribacter populi TaxID=2598460 RepID=UPI00117C5863|nr:hypothetical protein [Litoribacter populi]
MLHKGIFFFILFASVIFTFSCGENTSQTESNDHTELREEVIAIHDEVMPQMGRLKSLERRVASQKDSLVAQDSTIYAEEISQKAAIVDELHQAYDEMFVWMRQFRPDEVETENEEAYLLEQREKVKEVNRQIKSALERATAEVDN